MDPFAGLAGPSASNKSTIIPNPDSKLDPFNGLVKLPKSTPPGNPQHNQFPSHQGGGFPQAGPGIVSGMSRVNIGGGVSSMGGCGFGQPQPDPFGGGAFSKTTPAPNDPFGTFGQSIGQSAGDPFGGNVIMSSSGGSNISSSSLDPFAPQRPTQVAVQQGQQSDFDLAFGLNLAPAPRAESKVQTMETLDIWGNTPPANMVVKPPLPPRAKNSDAVNVKNPKTATAPTPSISATQEEGMRIFVGTYNVRGRPNRRDGGYLEHIDPKTLLPWVQGIVGGPLLPGLAIFALQEVMDLSPVNVVVDSIQPSEDHNARVEAWKDALTGALDLVSLGHPARARHGASYACVGQSTQVGLALFVFATQTTSTHLFNTSIGQVKTGWGGLLGNKGSVMWRADLGNGGPSICAVASHFASGRENVELRNDCFYTAATSRCFPALRPRPPQAGQMLKARPVWRPPPRPPPPPAPAAASRPPSAKDSGLMGTLKGGLKQGGKSLGQAVGRLDRAFEDYRLDFGRGDGSGGGASGGEGDGTGGQGVFDHDLVIWAGDLNYALQPEVDDIECRAQLGADLESSSSSDSSATAYITSLGKSDQLAAERAAGRVFWGFCEGALGFMPTYRTIVGSGAYDPKRCPAWTDRVLWWVRAGQRDVGSPQGPTPEAVTSTADGASAVRSLSYGCAWACQLSDHKPVFALLTVDTAQLLG